MKRSKITDYAALSNIFERKNAIIFLSISLNMCFGCSKEPSHRDGSSEYPQHMFQLRNKKFKFSLHTLNLSPDGSIQASLCKIEGLFKDF